MADPPSLPFPPRTWARIVAFLLPDAHHWGRVEVDVSDGRIVAVRIVESLREDVRVSEPDTFLRRRNG